MKITTKNFLNNPSLGVVTAFIGFTILSIVLLYISDENFFLKFGVLQFMTIINVFNCIRIVASYLNKNRN